MPVFWHTNPPEISTAACFILLLHLILTKGRSLPDLLDFISFSLGVGNVVIIKQFFEIISVKLLDTSLKTKTFHFVASADW